MQGTTLFISEKWNILSKILVIQYKNTVDTMSTGQDSKIVNIQEKLYASFMWISVQENKLFRLHVLEHLIKMRYLVINDKLSRIKKKQLLY